MRPYKQILICCLLAGACHSQRAKDDVTLHKAADVHNEMMKSAHDLEDRLNVMGRDSLSAALIDSVNVWKSLFEAWEEDVVEVPGNEAHAHHEGAHHHDHKIPEVTPDQMLVIQQELKSRLDQIRGRVDKFSSRP